MKYSSKLYTMVIHGEYIFVNYMYVHMFSSIKVIISFLLFLIYYVLKQNLSLVSKNVFRNNACS